LENEGERERVRERRKEATSFAMAVLSFQLQLGCNIIFAAMLLLQHAKCKASIRYRYMEECETQSSTQYIQVPGSKLWKLCGYARDFKSNYCLS